MMARVAAVAGLPRSLAWPAASRGTLSVSAMSSAVRGPFRVPPRVIPRPARPTRTAPGPLSQPPRRAFASRSNYEYFKPAEVTPFHRRRWVLATVGAVGVGTFVYVNHLEEVPMTHRQHFVLISKETEEKLADETYAALMKQYRRQLLPINDPITQRVRQVGSRIVAVTGMTDVQWEFHVINSPERNAFVLPGGKVFVFTGILPIMANDDGMAAVLGHEIGHQMARHGAEKMSLGIAVGIMQLIVNLMIGANTDQLGRMLFGLLLELPYSRKCELEADYIGLLLMSKACYNPAEAVNLWRRMNRASESEPLSFMSTHPTHTQRIERMNFWLPEATHQYAEAGCNGVMTDFRRTNTAMRAYR